MAEEDDSLQDIEKTHRELVRGAGGTRGGCGLFSIGFALAAGGLYLFLDSVRVSSAGHGLFSGMLYGVFGNGHANGAYDTTSMGLLFVPFFLGVVILFYDARLKIGWGLLYLGLGVLVVEILSRIRFFLHMKLTHLLLLLAMVAAGVGLMIRSFRDEGANEESKTAKPGT